MWHSIFNCLEQSIFSYVSLFYLFAYLFALFINKPLDINGPSDVRFTVLGGPILFARLFGDGLGEFGYFYKLITC